MAANYWLKLWVDMLDDPKVGLLDDRTWRRWVEILLLAKETGNDGRLPDMATMCWRLRTSEADLARALRVLEGRGLVQREEQGWRVVNFVKRQGPVPAAERKRRQRGKRQPVTNGDEAAADDVTKRDENGAENVTKREPEAEEQKQRNRGRGAEAEAEAEAAAAPFLPDLKKRYETSLGPLTPDALAWLEKACAYPAEWVAYALTEAHKARAKSWRYPAAVLARIAHEGGLHADISAGGNGKVETDVVEQVLQEMAV